MPRPWAVAALAAAGLLATATLTFAASTVQKPPGYVGTLPAPAPAHGSAASGPAPSGSPAKPASWLAYPGQPYPGLRPFCDMVDQQHLVPDPYSAAASEQYPGTDFQEDGTEMLCDLVFLIEPATGAYKLHAWVYADPARASRDYATMRQRFTTYSDRGNKGTTRGDLPGIGERAYQVYTPVSVSDRPNVRIQPGRHLDLVLLDANLVLTVSVGTLRPMGTAFPDSDSSYRDAIHRSVRDVLRGLRTGRASASCCG
jgi:hypothetical protein